MKKLIFLSSGLFLFCFSVFTSSCKHDPVDLINIEDTTTNSNNCDPDTVYFTQEILPVLQSSCALSGCHNSSSHKEGIILDSYANILNTGKIKINEPADSKIYEAMNENGDDIMPPSPAAPMSSEFKAKLLKWISQGAHNNSCTEKECDTTNVTYSGSIKPIITTYCQGCHSGSQPGAGIDLTSYNGVKEIALSGQLYGSVAWLGSYSPMPQNGNKLSDCNIKKIQIWINNGSLNN